MNLLSRAVVFTLALVAGCAASAQSPRMQFVTRNEMGQTLRTLENAVRAVLKMPPAGKAAIVVPKGTDPATRADAVAGLHRLHELAKPSYKFQPFATKFEPKRIKPLSGAKANGQLKDLLWWGYIAPVGPIAAGPSENLTLADWGDALGYWIGRVAELTHTPSSRYSPYLMRDGGASNVPARGKAKDPSSVSP